MSTVNDSRHGAGGSRSYERARTVPIWTKKEGSATGSGGGRIRGHSLQRGMSPSYILFPRFESNVLIDPPMNVIATIAATAMSARMSAYSAKPWPRCPLGTKCRTDVSLTMRSTSSVQTSNDASAISSRCTRADIGRPYSVGARAVPRRGALVRRGEPVNQRGGACVWIDAAEYKQMKLLAPSSR